MRYTHAPNDYTHCNSFQIRSDIHPVRPFFSRILLGASARMSLTTHATISAASSPMGRISAADKADPY
jgi:hypothetical protein